MGLVFNFSTGKSIELTQQEYNELVDFVKNENVSKSSLLVNRYIHVYDHPYYQYYQYPLVGWPAGV